MVPDSTNYCSGGLLAGWLVLFIGSSLIITFLFYRWENLTNVLVGIFPMSKQLGISFFHLIIICQLSRAIRKCCCILCFMIQTVVCVVVIYVMTWLSSLSVMLHWKTMWSCRDQHCDIFCVYVRERERDEDREKSVFAPYLQLFISVGSTCFDQLTEKLWALQTRH